MKDRCVVVAGGDCDLSLLSEISTSDFVIAADSGLNHLMSANVKPDLIVGDFDSYSGRLPEGIETVVLPTKKDDTDLLFSLRCGVERGFKKYLIFGGYGSRPDQNLAMLQSLVWLCDNCEAESVKAQCNGFEINAVKNSKITLSVGRERYFSVFSISGEAKGVEIIGADYPLENSVITPSFPIGVSNEADGEVTLSVKDGTLIIMTVDKNN